MGARSLRRRDRRPFAIARAPQLDLAGSGGGYDFRCIEPVAGSCAGGAGFRQIRAFRGLRSARHAPMPARPRLAGGGLGVARGLDLWRVGRVASEFCARTIGRGGGLGGRHRWGGAGGHALCGIHGLPAAAGGASVAEPTAIHRGARLRRLIRSVAGNPQFASRWSAKD